MTAGVPADRALLEAAGNPFTDNVARLDSLRPPPDVETIHPEVRRTLRAALDEVRDSRRPAMVAIKGDPGQGKTHELRWFRQRAEEGHYYFVDVPPLKSIEAPFRHILRYTVQGLLATRPGGSLPWSSLLERMLWECLRGVAAAARDRAHGEADAGTIARLDETLLGDERFVDTFAALAQGDPSLGDLLHAKGRGHPPLSGLDANLGRVLCRLTDRTAQAAVYDWLRGSELSDEDLALLKVRHGVDSEEAAFDVLKGVVSLCARPVALCFDQLETTGVLLGPDGAARLGTALMELYQQVPICIVLMSQSQAWPQFATNLSQAARDRIRELPPLAQLRPDQAIHVVERRLAPLWRASAVTPPNPSYPFHPGFLEWFVGQTRPTIRRVLAECADRLDRMRDLRAVVEARADAATGPSLPAAAADRSRRAAQSRAPDERAVLEAELARHVDGLPHGSLREPAAREDYLRTSLLRLLSLHGERRLPVGGARVLKVDDPARPRKGPRAPAIVALERGDERCRLAIEVHSSDGRSAFRALERLREQVRTRRADRAVLVREAEVPIGEGAHRSREIADALEAGGGGLLYLEKDAVHRLVGAELLLDAVSAAEVWVGNEQATRDAALAFILEHRPLEEALLPVVSQVFVPRAGVTARPPGPGADDLQARVLQLLGSDSSVMATDTLARALDAPREQLDRALASLEGSGAIVITTDRDRRPTVVLQGRR